MRKAIVSMTVDVELDVDTERTVTKLDQMVLDQVRTFVANAVNEAIDTQPIALALGHYVDRVSVHEAELTGTYLSK
jgi:hypothetical protein